MYELVSRVFFFLALIGFGIRRTYIALIMIPSGILIALFSLFAGLNSIFTNTSPDPVAFALFLWGAAVDLADTSWKTLVGTFFRISSRIDRFIKRLELTDDLTASLALSWLIQYCETPSAVDIALQAIAGAGQGFPKKPLLSCQAVGELMKRRMSDDPFDDDCTSRDCYTRGLKFLGFHSASDSVGEGKTKEEIKVMVWDLKTKHDRYAFYLL
jgi:hypothetical protein